MKAIAILLIAASGVFAQGTRADYGRAKALRKTTRGKVERERIRPHWLPDESALWYRNDLASGKREFVLVDIAKKQRRPLFDHARLAAALRAAGKTDAQADRLPIMGLELEGEYGFLWLKGDARIWKWHTKNDTVQPLEPKETKRFRLPVISPKVRSRRGGEESAIVFVNQTSAPVELLWVDMGGGLRSYGALEPGKSRLQHTFARHAWAIREKESGKLIQHFVAVAEPRIAVIDARRVEPGGGSGWNPRVSPDRKWSVRIKNHNVELVRQSDRTARRLTTTGTAENAFGGTVFWAPDSRSFVVLRTKQGDRRTISVVESAPKNQLQPRVHTFRYAKPGDRIDHPRPWLFRLKGEPIEIDDTLFAQPWSLTRFRWSKPGFTFLYNQRGHQVLRLIAIDAGNGKPRVLIEERSPTFLDYAGKLYLHEGRDHLIWMSERDGWNHLYRYDQSGKLRNRITKGDWAVRSVERVDRNGIWFWAGGVVAGEDPYHLHLCRANLDGTGFKVLTAGDGTHSVTFSPRRRTFIDSWSRVDQPPVHVLRSANDGALIAELERADWSALLATGWKPPIRFVAKGRDGKTDIFGIVHRPTNFDPKRRYPVVEAIYAGPHAAHVPKSFRSFHGAQTVAELGFLVVQIDGMGTSHRSKAFHDVCWKNLADAGFADRIAWMRAAAATVPQMDLTRVGIYGGSAGGQNAMGGLLAHPDFYKVGVADCGCHDNRMDKIWWNELWMGWPVGDHYKEQSNVTQAHKLRGKLLLIVGELDRNVDPASTMQVADALVKANKEFELVVIPGAGHGAASTPYGTRRLRDFLVRHLHGVVPRAN